MPPRAMEKSPPPKKSRPKIMNNDAYGLYSISGEGVLQVLFRTINVSTLVPSPAEPWANFH